MIAESIKEKLGLLKLYLTILIATAVAGMVWMIQNFDIAPLYKILLMLAFIIYLLLIAALLERKIHKLINFLETI